MPDITIKGLKQRHIEEFLEARREIKLGIADTDARAFATALMGFAMELAKQGLKPEQYNATITEYAQGVTRIESRRGELTAAEEDGIRVRAAVRVGWFGDELVEDDIAEMEPWRVDQLADAVAEKFNEAFEVPEN